jgi:hypothetical protein
MLRNASAKAGALIDDAEVTRTRAPRIGDDDESHHPLPLLAQRLTALWLA